MKALPNNCRVSKIYVSPENWKTCGPSSLKKKWYIKYRFYDDNLNKNKQVMISAFNRFDTVIDRRMAVEEQLKALEHDLFKIGYNPITSKTLQPVATPDSDIHKWTPFVPALKYARGMLKTVSENTLKQETDWVISQLDKAAQALRYDAIGIYEMSLKHLHMICERAAYRDDGSYSGDKFNRNKKVLEQLYKKLLILEVVPSNVPKSLERQKGAARKKKKVLTPEERERIKIYLSANSPAFLNFIQMFFYSGARLTEMMRLKVKDVDLRGQSIKYLVLKGRAYEEKDRPLLDIALPLWQSHLKGAKKTDYVFSHDLLPGDVKITENVVKKRWERLKDKLGLSVGFYSLKHLHTTEARKKIGLQGVATLNAESTEMIDKFYDVDKETRENDEIKKVRIKF